MQKMVISLGKEYLVFPTEVILGGKNERSAMGCGGVSLFCKVSGGEIMY